MVWTSQMTDHVAVLDSEEVLARLATIDVLGSLRRTFATLNEGRSVQPPQSLVAFPRTPGDFITYAGVLEQEQVFGVKVSPYFARTPSPLVTAWTLLMSMQTGEPLLLCDAKRLTTERTAGTTALAVDLLAAKGARRLAIIGVGEIAEAHLRHVLPLRDWTRIDFASRTAGRRPAVEFAHLIKGDSRISIASSVADAVEHADVILLCTSSGTPVLDPRDLKPSALVTSISTNAPQAHEIPPEALSSLDVYCDYRRTAPLGAGEMIIARETLGWSPDAILGDLAELVCAAVIPPGNGRRRFFRSIGLGVEDIAIAAEIQRAVIRQPKAPTT